MKLKPAIRKSHPDGFQHRPRLFLTPAVDDAIVRVPLERIVRKGPLHPRVERIMQKEIRQERACYSPYAKDNFTFDRVICGWGRGTAVFDLRLKR